MMSRRGVSLRTPRSAAKVEERRLRPERSEGLSDASRNPAREAGRRPPNVTALHTSPGFEAQAPGRLRTSTTGGCEGQAPGRLRTSTTGGCEAQAPGRLRTSTTGRDGDAEGSVRNQSLIPGRVERSGARTTFPRTGGRTACPYVHRLSGAGHDTRVVACRRGTGCERPAGRRTRSGRHGTRTGRAPAPHVRVLRPRGAQASVCPSPPARAGVGQHTGGGLPRLAHQLSPTDRNWSSSS
jgi:hypothetical protein